ncbi:MAG: glycerol-3-phosphate acyltransferase [Caldisericia bacterium]|nr:glycerol-3-phosphate acyltransferase [Caldisericia bacterium]
MGHAFSPFLKFRGGKAMASTFGLWTGITLWEGPTFMGLGTLFMCSIQNNSSICSLFGFLPLLIIILLRDYEIGIIFIFILNILIVFLKLRKDLFIKPKFGLRNPFKS